MKRGWITWDRREMAAAVFQDRLGLARQLLVDRNLPALCVYTDVWRSNPARFFANYMPYWNRALLVIPVDRGPILLTSLSSRVHPWVRSFSIVEEVLAAGNLAPALLQLAAKNRWKKIGILDLPRLPRDIYEVVCTATIEIANLPSHEMELTDEAEVFMRRKAAHMAREILDSESINGEGTVDYQFAGSLERHFRRAGAEEVQVLLTDGTRGPAPPNGAILCEHYSVMVALEYRGHWVKIARPHAGRSALELMRQTFYEVLEFARLPLGAQMYVENFSGAYPYECCDRTALKPGSIFALHVESGAPGQRLFYSDTCCLNASGTQIL